MTARNEILGRIRRVADLAGGSTGSRRAGIEHRFANPPRHVVPARASGKSRAELVAMLSGYLSSQSAAVIEVEASAQVPAAIAARLAAEGVPGSIRIGTDPVLAALPWSAAGSLRVSHGPARADDPVGVSRAVAGIAETGTLMLLSGRDNPVTLAFLPETHVVVLAVEAIVGTYEEAIAALRAQTAATGLPRTVNLVSGPSRTADIMGILVTGAHGPRRLIVVLVRGPG